MSTDAYNFDILMNEITKEAVKKCGTKAQILKYIEELNELSAALLHYVFNKGVGYNDMKKMLLDDKVIDEIVDVSIMTNQFIYIISTFALNDPNFAKEYNGKIINRMKFKLERLSGILNNR